jgi:hypothetical protein
MSIYAQCPVCSLTFRRPDGLAGKLEKCPECATVFRMPLLPKSDINKDSVKRTTEQPPETIQDARTAAEPTPPSNRRELEERVETETVLQTPVPPKRETEDESATATSEELPEAIHAAQITAEPTPPSNRRELEKRVETEAVFQTPAPPKSEAEDESATATSEELPEAMRAARTAAEPAAPSNRQIAETPASILALVPNRKFGVPPSVPSEIAPAASGNAQIGWHLFRAMAIILFLIAAVVSGGALSIVLYAKYNHYPLPAQFSPVQILVPVLFLVLLLVGLFLSNLSSKQLWGLSAADEAAATPSQSSAVTMTPVIGILVAVTAATVAVFSSNRTAGSLAMLTAVLAGLYVLMRPRPFSWTAHIAVGAVVILACARDIGRIQYYSAIVRPAQIVRENRFNATFEKIAPSLAHNDAFDKARGGLSGTSKIPLQRGGVLVLQAIPEGGPPGNFDAMFPSSEPRHYRLIASPIEFFLPPEILAQKVADLRTVVIVGPCDVRYRRSASRDPLIIPALIYQWPEKEPIGQIKLSCGRADLETETKLYSVLAGHLKDAAK